MKTLLLTLLCLWVAAAPSSAGAPVFNIRDHGAIGDGKTVDTPAINAAIEAASKAGGGTVWFPAGTYLSYSIRLQSNITLHLDQGATLLASDPPDDGKPGYDPAEPNEWGDVHKYQDFGHSHWKNSLIWGIGLENVAITGFGLIDGRGLVGAHRVVLPHERSSAGSESSHGGSADDNVRRSRELMRENRLGNGDKAIALKFCRNVTLRDFSVFRGGHFALLATGVDNLTIDNLRVDTNRDGFDIDACKNVRITNCSVNSPNDDAIVLKSSFGLGTARDTEHITISDCFVSGFAVGSLLNGTFDRSVTAAPDRDGPTGRIKFGTESNGGFKNITITNCVFERSRGIALETVDGGHLEDVTISNITMRDIVNAPIFLRLGNRARGPEGTAVGKLRRININNLTVFGADARYASQIVGLPGHPVEDVTLSNIRIFYRGGLTMAKVAEQPENMVNPFFLRRGDRNAMGPREPFDVPEQASSYPEPSMFGLLPAYGLYVRHATNIRVHQVQFDLLNQDTRPVVVLEDVTNAEFNHFEAEKDESAPTFVLRSVRDFRAYRTQGVPELLREAVEKDSF